MLYCLEQSEGLSKMLQARQVPLILQGTFIQITNVGGSTGIGLQYRPTVPFVASPPGGKIKLTANYINTNLNISDITQNFTSNPSSPSFGFNIPAGGTIIVGVQYVATGLSLVAAPLAADGVDNLPGPQVEHATLVASRDEQASGAFADAAKLDDVDQVKLVELARESLFADEVAQPRRLAALIVGHGSSFLIGGIAVHPP